MKPSRLVYLSQGNSTMYLLTKDQGRNFDDVIQMLNAVTYTKKLNTFRGGTGDALFMTIVYRDRNGELKNFDVDVRELGILKSHGQEYRIHGNSKELMNKLVDWIRLSDSNFRSVS